MSASVGFAFALDLAIGDPRRLPHPVRAIGAVVVRGEALVRPRFSATPRGELVAGGVLAIATIAGTALASAVILAVSRRCGRRVAFGVELALAASTLSTRDLLSEASAVARALRGDDLVLARTRVARIVGRDTRGLDATGVARAAIESVAESCCDGIAAPLFFLALGGVPAALAFKAASTLDSMIGHREAPYATFGTVAARIDDAANYLPARLTALALATLAPLVGGDARAAFAVVRADARAHASPNAGYGEAAMAGALGVRLGGPVSYDGIPRDAPLLGANGRSPTLDDLMRAPRLCAYASCALACIAVAVRRAFRA